KPSFARMRRNLPRLTRNRWTRICRRQQRNLQRKTNKKALFFNLSFFLVFAFFMRIPFSLLSSIFYLLSSFFFLLSSIFFLLSSFFFSLLLSFLCQSLRFNHKLRSTKREQTNFWRKSRSTKPLQNTQWPFSSIPTITFTLLIGLIAPLRFFFFFFFFFFF